jgi:hypothetical protein
MLRVEKTCFVIASIDYINAIFGVGGWMSSNPWYYVSKPNEVLQDKRSSHQSHLNGHGLSSQQFDLTNHYDVYLSWDQQH